MKPCKYCGYSFEHKEETCRSLIVEKRDVDTKKKKIHHVKLSTGRPGLINISRKNVVELANYLNKKRI